MLARLIRIHLGEAGVSLNNSVLLILGTSMELSWKAQARMDHNKPTLTLPHGHYRSNCVSSEDFLAAT
jgi:hypothetical protein